MFARLLPSAALLSACTLGLLGCGTPTQKVNGTLFAVVTPAQTMVSDGSTVNIKFTALDLNEKPGTGELDFAANTGAFGNGQTTQKVTLAADGTGSADYACNVATSPNCVGQVEVSGAWNGVRTLLFITLTPKPDAGS